MSSNRFARLAATTLATAVAVGAMTVLSAATASAATGTITFAPNSGADTSVFNVNTSDVCPAADPYVYASIAGGTFPATAVAINKEPTNVLPAGPNNVGYSIAISNNLRQLATNYSVAKLNPDAPNPTTYTIDVKCVPSIGTTVGADFSGTLKFTSETAWTSAGQTATQTTVTPTPASPVTVGQNVTLTANIAPAAAGTVQFLDGTTALNATPAAVTAGVATYQTAALAVGTHSITAVFTSTDPNFAGSTSPAISYVVNPAGPTPTTTSLITTPGSAQVAGSNVNLSANVTPANAAGSIAFSDGTTVLATVPLVNGAAQYNTTTLAVGTHTLNAAFVPADTTKFQASSASVPITITTYVPPKTNETITTTMDAGSLSINVPTGQVALPNPVLNSAGTMFTTSGALEQVTVTDNRAGNPGWTVSGLATAFVNGTAQINAENLGWTPATATGSAGQVLTTGPAVPAAAGVPAADNHGLGLSASQVLGSAAAGGGLGTAKLGAALALNVPTTTTAGTYTSTLTLTVI